MNGGADLDELGFVINEQPAVRALGNIDTAAQKAGRAADNLTDRLKKQDEQLRRLVESGVMQSDTLRRSYENQLRATGQWERYLQIQKQVNDEMRVADQVAQRHAAATEKLAAAKNSATLATGRLRGGLATLASQAAGVNPTLGQLASSVGMLAAGGAVTAGVLVGVAAIGAAYRKFADDAKKAREHTDELIASLLRQRQVAQENTVQGQQAFGFELLQREMQLLERLNRAKAGQRQFDPATGGMTKTIVDQTEVNRLSKEYADLQASIAQNEINVAKAKAEAHEAANPTKIKAVTAAIKEQRDAVWQLGEAYKYAETNAQLIVRVLTEIGKEQDAARAALTLRMGLGGNPVSDIERAGGLDNLVDPKILARFSKDVGDLSENMRQIWRAGIGRILTDGTESFREFFENVLSMFERLMRRMEQEGKDSGLAFQLLGLGTAAIGGGFAGHQIGQRLGGVGGVVGGAGVGAAQGAIVAGLPGAVIGGLAGLAGGLLGASDAARAAARELQRLRDASVASAAAYAREARGFTTVDDRIADELSKANVIANDARKSMSGKALEDFINGVFANFDRIKKRLLEEDAFTKEQERASLEVRMLRAKGLDAEADALAFAQAQQKEYNEAVLRGADAAYLASLTETQKAEAAKRAADAEKAHIEEVKRAMEEFARASKQMRADTSSRIFSALGQTREAEDIQRGFNAAREMEEAIKAGMDPATLAMLALAHVLENQAVILQRAFEDQVKAIEAATKEEMDSLDRQMAAVKLISEVEQKAFAEQIQKIRKDSTLEQKTTAAQIAALRDASSAEQKSFSAQIDALRKEEQVAQKTAREQLDVLREQLNVARTSLSEQSRSVQETERVLDTLRTFASGLSLSPLSVLSPIQQLSEARRQYEATLALANSGDKTAAGNLPGIARSFLDASRNVNASGPGYVQDFFAVQEAIASLTDRFGTQLTVEEQILRELESQHATLEAQIVAVETAREVAAANAAAQIEALQEAKDRAQEAASAQIEAMQLARDRAQEAAAAQLDLLQDAKDRAMESAARQLEELQKAKDEARAAADAQIAALQQQMQEQLKAYAESIKFYNEWKRMSDEMLGNNIRYFAEMVEKLGGIIENTLRTANNLELWKKGPPPVVPDPDIPDIKFNTQATVNELRATVGLLSAGFAAMNTKLDHLGQAIGENTTTNRQGFEAVAVATRS